jgi:hypothetical protein
MGVLRGLPEGVLGLMASSAALTADERSNLLDDWNRRSILGNEMRCTKRDGEDASECRGN